MQTPTPFKFTLGQRLALLASGENGEAIARSEHANSEPQYLLRYLAGDGRATEAWWAQSALEACEGVASRASLQADMGATDAAAAPAEAGPGGQLDVPRIGAWWPGQGGLYAGIARGAEGAPDHHLILSVDKPAADLAWQDAVEWAAAYRTYGHADWSLPNRVESALLFANLRAVIEQRWHWTSEQYSDAYAWNQSFDYGGQIYNLESVEARARAVRRLPFQSFNPS